MSDTKKINLKKDAKQKIMKGEFGLHSSSAPKKPQKPTPKSKKEK